MCAIVSVRKRFAQFLEGVRTKAGKHEQPIDAQDPAPFCEHVIWLRMPMQRQIRPDQVDRLRAQRQAGKITTQDRWRSRFSHDFARQPTGKHLAQRRQIMDVPGTRQLRHCKRAINADHGGI